MTSGDTGVDSGPHRLETVRAALERSLRSGKLADLKLAFEKDGVLVVEGEVAGIAAKKRALRIAAITSGAGGLIDRLHVRPATPMEDGEIRVHLAELFALDPRFTDIALFEDRSARPVGVKHDYSAVAGASSETGGRLTIAVRDGVVTLDGAVPSLVRMRLAGAIAWGAPGVRDVVNGLTVRPPEEDGPDQLEEAVREALDGHPLFDDAQVKVGAFGDSVRLTGLVHSDDARDAAEETAWRILGVDEVINEIEVAPSGQRSSS